MNNIEDREKPMAMIVDDDEAILDSTMPVLQRSGFEVVCCKDGESALDRMAVRLPDVILLDLKMPGMPGEEFLKAAKEVDHEAVIIVVTGYPELSSAVEVMSAGAYDYLTKPFGAEQLRMLAGRALEKRRLAIKVAQGEREKQKMRDNFVAMVAHQLKSPAASIKECLDAVRSTLKDNIPQKHMNVLDGASRKAGLLLNLMDDWLTLARLESTELTAETQELELEKVLEDAVNGAREMPDHNDVELKLQVESALPPVRGDMEALTGLFVNLMDNALRYTPDGGAVVVAAKKGREGIFIEVTDTGPGIPPEKHQTIFEPFTRSEESKTKHGTGLGLAIASRIVEAHAGTIEVESEEGRGATFRVHLPASGGKG